MAVDEEYGKSLVGQVAAFQSAHKGKSLEDVKQIVEELKRDAEDRFNKAAPTSWKKEFAAGEIEMANKILEKLK